MGHDSQIQNVKWLANTREKRGRRKQKPFEDEKPTDSQDWNHSMNPSRNTHGEVFRRFSEIPSPITDKR
jgi:hypothetical protein